MYLNKILLLYRSQTVICTIRPYIVCIIYISWPIQCTHIELTNLELSYGRSLYENVFGVIFSFTIFEFETWATQGISSSITFYLKRRMYTLFSPTITTYIYPEEWWRHVSYQINTSLTSIYKLEINENLISSLIFLIAYLRFKANNNKKKTTMCTKN